MSRFTSGSTSSDLAKGKKFIKKLLYVQHVDKEKETASEIPDRYLEEFSKADRTDFPDSNFTKYLASPKENLSLLKSSMKDLITEVTVYSNPLPIPLQVKDVTIHAFVVFKTKHCWNDTIEDTWWSIEKNGQYIVLQQSPNKDDVINKIYDTETKTSVERLGPIKKQKSDSVLNFFGNLMGNIVDTNEINERYHLLYSNCQNFASFVFEKLSHGKKKWSTVTSAAVDRLGLKKKKIQPKIKVDAFKYKSILKDDNFDCYWAMMEGRRKDFEKLIKEMTIETLNQVDSQGNTLLEWATVFSSSDWPIDQKLKNKGAEILSDERSFRRNVFFIALQYLPSNQKSKLLSFDDIDINGVNGTGDTALHLALYGEKWQIAEEILCKFEKYDVNKTNSIGDTSLLLAAKLKCEISLLKKILEKSNDINAQDNDGSTALHYVILSESEMATKELLARSDVNVDIKNNRNESALLLASSIRMNFPSDLLKLILEKSKDINSQDKNGDTALHLAICRQSEIVTRELLAHYDADVNVKNNINRTALHLASDYWRKIPVDLFNLILENSDNINAQDNDGDTALHCAISEKSKIATRELLAHNDVNVDIKNKDHETAVTAVHLASERNDFPPYLFRIIIKRSTDINAQNKNGNTPLHNAIFFKSEMATKSLLNHKDVDVNIKNNDHETALSYASRWEDIPSDLFNLISERSANVAKEK